MLIKCLHKKQINMCVNDYFNPHSDPLSKTTCFKGRVLMTDAHLYTVSSADKM